MIDDARGGSIACGSFFGGGCCCWGCCWGSSETAFSGGGDMEGPRAAKLARVDLLGRLGGRGVAACSDSPSGAAWAAGGGGAAAVGSLGLTRLFCISIFLARSAMEEVLRRELSWQLEGNAGFMLPADDPPNLERSIC